jgi:hypothetical protein
MPDAPDRRTARQMIRAAQMTGADPAAVLFYMCVTVSKSGDLEMAGNVSEEQLGYILGHLTEQLEAGGLRREEPGQEAPERPGLN